MPAFWEHLVLQSLPYTHKLEIIHWRLYTQTGDFFYDLQLLKARVDVEDNMAMSPSPPYRGDSREGNFLPLSYIWISCCVDLRVYFSSFVRAVSNR